MRIKYFPDTDTTIIELAELPVTDTQAFGDNLTIDFDAAGQAVAITIEHASKDVNMKEIAYLEMPTA